MDTIICHDKQDAKKTMKSIGMKFIYDWDYLEDGKIKLYLLEGWKNERRSI